MNLFAEFDVTTNIRSWNEAVQQSFYKAFDQIAVRTPNVLAMIVVLVIGYFVARVLDRAVAALAHSLGLQAAAERSGLAASMKQVGLVKDVPTIVGRIVFWLTMCVCLSAAFNILGLTEVSAAVDSLVNYVPKLLIATAIVVVGLLVATFLRGLVATSADRVGLSYAEALANGCYYILALMTFLAAAEKLDINFKLFEQMILIAFAALALGVGLALGLGGREVMGGILAGYYTRQRLQNGDRIRIGGVEGIVRDVGPVATTIETEEDGLIHRRSVPNVKMINEAVR
ncbi:MAG: mechanosensitive ion channel [Planctomycetaceae bacterium]|nr:mechanosensitive ion channel [Planctomycetaceae bacterium]